MTHPQSDMISSITNSATAVEKAVETAGKNDRNLMISVVMVFLAFVGILLFWVFTELRVQRESFMTHIDKSINKMSESLDNNGKAMYELKTAIESRFTKQ